jgi:N-glycosylase/DNA lyase
LELIQTPFNLDLTLCCGQVFKWEKKEGWWYGIVRDNPIKIRQIDKNLEFENASLDTIKNYFGLNYNLYEIKRKISKDKYIESALNSFWGLRIIKQDPWECLISYICATYKSIAAIRNMLLKISEKFGEQKILNGYVFYTFPKPEKLQSATELDLLECGLGYRSKYVLKTSKTIFRYDSFFDELKNLSYSQAKKQLIDFPGIGPKVADCILLFSLEKNEAFPVDIWVKRAILNHYSDYFPPEFISKISRSRSISNSEYKQLNEFGRNYFGDYAGYAQEYLFHFERMSSKKNSFQFLR